MQSDYYTKIQPQQVPYQQTENEKRIGNKFNKVFIITLLFLLLSHSYKFFDNIYFMFTQKQFEMFDAENCKPTIKGYAIVTLLFFIIVFFL